MLDFSQKTFSEILTRMMQSVPNTVNKRDGSLLKTALAPAAWVHEGLYMDLDTVQRQGFGDTATGEDLDMIVYMANVARKQPTKAVWRGSFTIAPTIGTQFVARDYTGILSYTVTTEALKNDETGRYECLLMCDTAGSVGNVYGGIITAKNFIPGMVSSQLTALVSSGEDVETDDALRERWRSALKRDKFTGNIASYKSIVEGMDGIGRCVVFPTFKGAGTVSLSVIDLTYDPCLPEDVERVKAFIDPDVSGDGYGWAPVGASVTVKAPSKLLLSIVASVELNAGASIDDARAKATAKIEEHLYRLRKGFDNGPNGAPPTNITIRRNDILAFIQTLDEVADVKGEITINNKAQDRVITQNGSSQALPYLGSLTLEIYGGA